MKIEIHLRDTVGSISDHCDKANITHTQKCHANFWFPSDHKIYVYTVLKFIKYIIILCQKTVYIP